MILASPIFILGAPRSGTNLLANILSRLPNVEICRETHFFHYAYLRRRSFGDLQVLRNRIRLVDAFLALERTKRMRVDLGLLREYLLREATDYRLFQAALLQFYADAHGKRRAGEQQADHRLAETYCEWFPDARIIHLVRDPRAVVQSLMTMPWAHRSIVANARRWRSENLSLLRLQGRPQYLQVSYERLALEPEDESRRVCAFIGETYLPGVLNPATDSRTDLLWLKRAEQGINTSRVGLWRETFSRAQIGLIEWMAEPLLGTFGYQPEGLPPSAGAKLSARAQEIVHAVQRRIHEFPGSLYYVTRSTNLAAEERAKQRLESKRTAAAT